MLVGGGGAVELLYSDILYECMYPHTVKKVTEDSGTKLNTAYIFELHIARNFSRF